MRRYQANGFFPITNPPSLRYWPAASVDIVKGDALHDDTTGYATNATTAFAATFLGIAAEDCANSGASKGDLDVAFYPVDHVTQYMVPVAASALATQSACGTIVDLEANDDVDLSDTTIAAGPGFYIDEIDVSAEAVAANTYGYVIGHFAYVS